MKPSVEAHGVGSEPAVPAPPIKCRSLAPQDCETLAEFLAPYDTVSFCDWQDENATMLALQQPNTVAFGAFIGRDHMVGAIIGGCMGTRAVVNHLAVHVAARNQGVGDQLFSLFKGHVRQCEIYRIFLFVDGRNRVGRRFWEQRNFKEIVAESTLEVDI